MKIEIKELRFDAIIGILDFERKTPQQVEIECEIEYDYKDGIFLDYAEIVTLLESTIKEGEFYLLEEALEKLFQKTEESFHQIETIKIKISKPDILPNCRVCVSDFRSYL